MRKILLLTLVILGSLLGGSALIWHGLNLDQEKPQILGQASIPESPAGATSSASIQNKDKYLVTKVVDGDTFQIKVNNQTLSVRLIGIDTPETVDPRRPVGCFGKKASEETKRLIEGKEVILTKDISDTDKYHRLLRYVFLPISGGENLLVNDYLVRQGFAKSLTYPPDIKYNDRFIQAEKEARENLRGLWNECK